MPEQIKKTINKNTRRVLSILSDQTLSFTPGGGTASIQLNHSMGYPPSLKLFIRIAGTTRIFPIYYQYLDFTAIDGTNIAINVIGINNSYVQIIYINRGDAVDVQFTLLVLGERIGVAPQWFLT